MQPGHPPRIRACIERLATRLTVSRHIKEQNEKQVSELLQLACEVDFSIAVPYLRQLPLKF